MRRGTKILVAILALSGCATEAPAPPSQEVHRYCAGQMYARRVGHARGAPMWTIYDYCLKQHQT
jgi:hypothetical protein